MGITGLSKVIGDYAPSAIKEHEMKTYFGKLYWLPLYDALTLLQFSLSNGIWSKIIDGSLSDKWVYLDAWP